MKPEPREVVDETLALVLAWVRQGLQPAEARGAAPAEGLEGAEVADLIRRHQLAPFLAFALPGAGGVAVARQHATNLKRALRRVATLLELGGRLTAAGIPWLTVKGPVLAVEWWGAVERRRAGDLDIVVPEARIREADRLLRAAGWRRTKPNFELTPRQWEAYPRLRHELGYVFEEGDEVKVELQWRLEGVDDLEAHWTAPHRVMVAGRPVPTLPPEVHFRYLCRHGARHAWFRLFWLLDVAWAFGRKELNWAVVLPEGRDDSNYRAVAQAAWLVEELLGVSTPAGLLPVGSGRERAVAWLVTEARAQVEERRSQFQAMGVWWRQLRYRTGLEPGVAGVKAALLPHWQSTLNWQTQPLPDRWFWLYAWLSPFLWLARVWKRSRQEGALARPGESLRRLARRPAGDWWLLAEALGGAVAAKLRLWVMPFAQIAPGLGGRGAETLRVAHGEGSEGRDIARRVSWAVQAVGRYLPERVVCFPQAMAAQRMLARRGVTTTLYLGVKPDEAKAAGMGAHAWLRAGSFIVTGKAARPGHVAVGTFARTGPSAAGWQSRARGWVIGGTIAGMVIATLAPWPPLQGLRRRSWAAQWGDLFHWLGANDFLLNLMGFAVVNAMLHLAWFGRRRAPWRYRLRSAAVVLALATALECAQLALPGRHFDPMDLVAAVVAIPLSTLPWMVRRGHRRGGSP